MDELLSSFFLFFFKTTSQSKKGISFDNSRRMRELRSGGSFSYIYDFKKDPNFAWGFYCYSLGDDFEISFSSVRRQTT